MTNSTAVSGVQFVTFENTNLNIVDLDGSVWLTAGDLARALGYKDARSISNLYNRNKDEFQEGSTALIDLKATETNGITSSVISANLESKVRIYSVRGCWTVGFLARSEKARAFRTWVMDVLEKLPTRQAPQTVTSAPKAALPDFLKSSHDKTLFKDAVRSSALHMLMHSDFTEEQRYMDEKVNKRLTAKMEDIACHEYGNLRLLLESDNQGGFNTQQVMPGVNLLRNDEIAAHILSAKGPLARYLPAIMQACAQRMQAVCDLPLAGIDSEGINQ